MELAFKIDYEPYRMDNSVVPGPGGYGGAYDERERGLYMKLLQGRAFISFKSLIHGTAVYLRYQHDKFRKYENYNQLIFLDKHIGVHDRGCFALNEGAEGREFETFLGGTSYYNLVGSIEERIIPENIKRRAAYGMTASQLYIAIQSMAAATNSKSQSGTYSIVRKKSINFFFK